MSSQHPTDAPPSYEAATGRKSTSIAQAPASGSSLGGNASSHLQVPGTADITPERRRSMEDEGRPLPSGWIRCFDEQSQHQFFVDTKRDPPRSIWHHPYDDDDYLATLTSEERERIEEESLHRGRNPSHSDIVASHSDMDDDTSPTSPTAAGGSKIPSELPPRPGADKDKGKGKGAERSFGRRFKDKVTGTTHEEREQHRKRRAEEERRFWEQNAAIRRAMVEASRTGQPVLLGKDEQGKDVFVEPPPQAGQYYGRGGYGRGGFAYPGGGYGYSPYAAPGGAYSTPNARYLRPTGPYGRPMGGGYGGGYGLPLALGGGLLGGLLIGDLLF